MADYSVVANIDRVDRNRLDFVEELVAHMLVRIHSHLVGERLVVGIGLEGRTFGDFGADLEGIDLKLIRNLV